jgi:hypothetical protein
VSGDRVRVERLKRSRVAPEGFENFVLLSVHVILVLPKVSF